MAGSYTKGARTKRKLVEAAAAEFALHGHEARISDMAARVGLTQPAFYRHFETKEAVHEAVVSDFGENLRDLVENSLLSPDADIRDVSTMTAMAVTNLMAFLDDNRDAMTVAMLQEPEGEKTRQELIRKIAANVAKETADGHFRADISPEFFATCLVGIVTQVVRSPAGADERHEQARQIARLLHVGIAAGTTPDGRFETPASP